MSIVGEVSGVLRLLWQIKDIAAKAHRNNHQCEELRKKVELFSPLFAAALEALDSNDHVLKRLEAFALSTLSLLQKFQEKSFVWKMLFHKEDKMRFKEVFRELDALQIEISLRMQTFVVHQIKALSSFITANFQKEMLTALFNDILLDKAILMGSISALPVEDMKCIRENIVELKIAINEDPLTAATKIELELLQVEEMVEVHETGMSPHCHLLPLTPSFCRNGLRKCCPYYS